MKTTCFVVATKDRPDDLRRMLESLAAQSHLPDLVIIVDGSTGPVRHVVDEFREDLCLLYLHHQPPSASGQRNAGLRAVPPEAELVGFLDDDAVLETGALERMMAFWDAAPADLGGCAFNMINHPAMQASLLKRTRMAEMLGLYSPTPGVVMPSGWQTMIGEVNQTAFVDWLPSTAVIWRAEILKTCYFDEFFTGYSYLEDLDFSFTIRRHWRLAVVADARYGHYPSPVRHSRQYDFGKTEVRNRLYFVKKHGISVPKCWLGLLLRMGMTVGESVRRRDRAILLRAWGNCVGIAAEIRRSALRRKPRLGQAEESSQ